jgi:hypothetical protein
LLDDGQAAYVLASQLRLLINTIKNKEIDNSTSPDDILISMNFLLHNYEKYKVVITSMNLSGENQIKIMEMKQEMSDYYSLLWKAYCNAIYVNVFIFIYLHLSFNY